MGEDAIIALATPPGRSALAVIRLSGPGVLERTKFLASVKVWRPRGVHHAILREGDRILDEVVISWWPEGASYTGEETIEISCHGNPLIFKSILEAYLKRGVRWARPGEFTERAFLNGKMDLTQAEGVLDLIHAGTDRSVRAAQAMREGRFGLHLLKMREQLIEVLAHLEAYIDFPEEDIRPETGSAFQERLNSIRTEMIRLLKTAPLGRRLREGVRTAIVGEPNVGKSSLLNALLREDRAIVSPTPGTTRDTIEASCQVRGLQLCLIDTAGQRETSDTIEKEGISRARRAMEEAELILQVVDASQPVPVEFPEVQPGQFFLRVANKLDLGVVKGHEASVLVSARTGEGLDLLESKIESLLMGKEGSAEVDEFAINTRQEGALSEAQLCLENGLLAIEQGAPPELISVDLRSALDAIGEVVGKATNEDILDVLFQKFCIGK